MFINQISVFIENKHGRLSNITETLKKEQINILAITIADTTDFGILRLIVDNPEKAEKSLKDSGFTVRVTKVLAVKVPHVPGGLGDSITKLTENGISIEYMYALASDVVIIKPNDNEKTSEIAKSNDIPFIADLEQLK